MDYKTYMKDKEIYFKYSPSKKRKNTFKNIKNVNSPFKVLKNINFSK